MADSPVTRTLARIRLAYARSRFRRFLTWWARELSPLVPARVRDWLVERRDELIVRVDDEAVVLRRASEAPDAARVVPRNEPEDVQRAAILRELDRAEERPEVVFCIGARHVLRRTLNLPLAAEENLRQVLGFEMDRQSPFRAEQVYFDHRVLGRDAAAKQLSVELALVPRAHADAARAPLAALGVPLDALDACVDDARLGFNLLPLEQRATRPNVWLRINSVLAIVVVALFGVVMVQSLRNREGALDALRTQAEGQSRDARSVAQLRTALSDAIEGANFLAERKRARPPVIDVLLDVTRRLPKDTWLQRFQFNQGQVQLQGQSKEASSLIALLQQSPVLESPALQGAITPDQRTGKEQFLIAANAKLPGPAPAKTPEKTDANTAQR
ncbi:MAG TPA: PilN domain-containing protein [Candidatus Saccharimonadia bacterium]|nr:PilN domain-containing protein [Candidatus Saccharimonadia bacterium]